MLRIVSFLVLLGLALAVAVMPDLARRVAGFEPLRALDPESMDRALPEGDREAPRFLAERNRVRVKVPRAMTVGTFMDLYQIRFEHVREQIAEQLGVAAAGDDHPLEAGQQLTLELTPPSS